MSRGLRRGGLAAAALLALLSLGGPLAALGLAGADSRAGLKALRPPLRFFFNADALSAALLGPEAKPSELAAQAYALMEKAGLPLKDGEFDPLKEAFVSLDLWVRGGAKADDPKDPRRVFDLQLQVFAPASLLKGSKEGGRLLLWERRNFGACKAGELKEQLAVLFGLCEQLGSEFQAARSPKAAESKRQ